MDGETVVTEHGVRGERMELKECEVKKNTSQSGAGGDSGGIIVVEGYQKRRMIVRGMGENQRLRVVDPETALDRFAGSGF